MKKILVSILIIVVVIAIFAIFFVFRNFKRLDQLTIVSALDIVSLPFEVTTGGFIVIQVAIDTSGNTYPFILDSGASNFLFKTFPKEKTGKTIGRGISRDANGQISFPKIKTLPYLRMGPIHFKDVAVNTINENFNCLGGIYGIVGKNSMRHFVWQFDYKSNVVHIAKNASLLPKTNRKQIKIPLKYSRFSHHLYVPIKFGKEIKSTLILDTGKAGMLSLDRKIVDQLEVIKEIPILGEGSRGLGGKSSSQQFLVKIKGLDLGAESALNMGEVTASVSEDSNFKAIGMQFLKNFKFTIDWKNRLLTLEQQVAVLDFTIKGFGISLGYENDQIYIKSVMEGSKAQQMGIEAGAKDFMINEQFFKSEAQFCAFRGATKDLDTLRIIFPNDGKEYLLDKYEY